MISIFSRYKLIFYFFNFALIFLYLFPGSFLGCYLYDDCLKQPQITSDFVVSSNHLYAFFILSVVGFLTFKRRSVFKILSIYLISLSIILELFHFIIPGRSFELSDLFGNLLGVSIVLTINFFYGKYENYKN